jgi:hypothetical protein
LRASPGLAAAGLAPPRVHRGLPRYCGLRFQPDEDDGDSKSVGELARGEIVVLLSM